MNHLRDGLTQGYWSADDANAMLSLARRAHKATSGLLRYLESCKGIGPPAGTKHPQAPEEPEEPTMISLHPLTELINHARSA